jgi:membrane fusion protein
MTTNTPNHPFFRTAAVTAASDTKFAGSIVLAQPVPMRVAACVACGIVLALVLLLTCGHYTRTAKVSGLLSPAAGSVKVFAPSFARITRSFVANDAPVVAGQPLFELTAERGNDTRVPGLLADRRSERQQAAQLQIEELQRRAQALTVRRRSIEAEIDKRQEGIRLQDAQVQNARDKQQRYRKLKGFVSKASLNDLGAEVSAQLAKRNELEGALLAIRRDLQDVDDEASGIDNKITQIANQAKQDVAGIDMEAAEREGRTLLRAPIAGTVSAVTLEAGQTVANGAPLATILPAGSQLEARLMVPSRARGFIAPGQHVLMRVDAFPYQKFGEVPGVVTHVDSSPIADGDANTGPLFRVTVRLDRQSLRAYGEEKTFSAGMKVEADILQDRRRLIEWLVVEPLVSATKGDAG